MSALENGPSRPQPSQPGREGAAHPRLHLDKLDDWLVDGWRCAWRMASLQLHTLASAALMLFAMVPSLPGELQQLIPNPWRGILVALWWVIGTVLRLKKQKGASNAATAGQR